jgi:hypothetical protein
MHLWGRSSSNLVAGEAVCGRGVDVTCGMEWMGGSSCSRAETIGLPLALRSPAGIR